MKRIPVILDTDIGSDIDDSWALALLLRSSELDLRLVATDSGNTTYRARVAARLLESGGRDDVPIGIGIHQQDSAGPQAPWVAGYDLSRYAGPIHGDGVGALVNTIMSAPEPVTLIAIGPVPNIAAALEREPRIAERARFVGMHGSIRVGYDGSPEPVAEYNVRAAPLACRAAFQAPWPVTITPLDTCGLITLEGAKYRAVRDHGDPLIQALMESYDVWAEHIDWTQVDPRVQSSTLFDTVAIYLAFADELLAMEKLGIRVTGDGYTVVDDSARTIDCAVAWRDLAAFEDLLVTRLTGRDST